MLKVLIRQVTGCPILHTTNGNTYNSVLTMIWIDLVKLIVCVDEGKYTYTNGEKIIDITGKDETSSVTRLKPYIIIYYDITRKTYLGGY